MTKVKFAKEIFEVIFPLIADENWEELKRMLSGLDPLQLDPAHSVAYLRGLCLNRAKEKLEPEYSEFLNRTIQVFKNSEMDYKTILKGLLGDFVDDGTPVLAIRKR